MTNNPTTKKQKNILPSFRKELFKLNLKSARDHYGNYMDKILEVTEGKVLYDYDEFNKKKQFNHQIKLPPWRL
jgi:hypothetical protein